MRVAPFRVLDDSALERLDDDALVEYMRRARAAGDPSAGRALAVLVFGHWRNVERRVRLKVPPEHVEDVTADIVSAAILSAFDGRSVGEFRSWLDTITRRAVAGFHRRRAGRPDADELRDDHAAPSDEGTVELRDAIGRVLAGLRPEHRRVVELVLLEGRPAAEAAGPDMSTANVHQIVRRFRVALREELGGDTGGG